MSNEKFLLLRTLGGERAERPPVWFMRQAGRSLPEYRSLRERYSMLDLIRTPELAAEVTLQPIERFGFDAAIIFADILNPLMGMGMDLDFHDGKGPIFSNPIRSEADIRQLVVSDPVDTVGYTMSALRIVRKALDPRGITLIGFCGAPFSLAAYMVEGASTRDGLRVKQLMIDNPSAWSVLQDKLASYSAKYLLAQVEAGVQCLQIFDSSIGLVTPQQYRTQVLPWVRELIGLVRERSDVPIIYFPFNGNGLLSDVATLECTGVSIDWRLSLHDAGSILNLNRVTPFVLQGNLDPALLCCDLPALEKGVEFLLEESAALSVPHVFNLGHGVTPLSSIENIGRAVEMVKAYHYPKRLMR
jgi:uroporphyrinogen decarboxylase